MRTAIKKMLVIAVVSGLWCILFQNAGFAGAKDPDYPTKPVEYIINFGAGGSTDLAHRAFIEGANKHLPQPLIPINKEGGSGAIGVMALKNAKPDGYTIGSVTSSASFVVPFQQNAPYKDLSALTFITKFGTNIYPVLVRNDSPWKTWKDFVEWARKNPRGTKVGLTGAKTADVKGLVLLQVEKKEKLEFAYLAFKSSAEVLTAILGGHINLYGSTADPSTLSYIREGKLRILTYLSSDKVSGYEGIPSTVELYGLECSSLLCVAAPKGIPEYAVKKLEDVFAKAVKEPVFTQMMARMNMPIDYMNRATLTKYTQEYFAKMAKVYEQIRADESKKK